jgi:hypothetical protein
MTDDQPSPHIVRARQQVLQSAAESKLQAARQREQDEMNLAQLTAQLHATCAAAPENADLAEMAGLLRDQSFLLDACFRTALHQAGLGRQGTLRPEPLMAGLHAQKLCRQTFDTLKKAGREALEKNSGKQKEGSEKCPP